MNCRHCESDKTRKNGMNRGIQRYLCNACGRTFSEKAKRYTLLQKGMAMMFYLNNVGIRKAALFIGCTPPTILNWIKEKHKIVNELLDTYEPNLSSTLDIIELDEIYTHVKKKRLQRPSYGLLILETQSVLLRLK